MTSIPNPKSEHDLALTALLQAYEHIGGASERLSRAGDRAFAPEQGAAPGRSDEQKRSAVPGRSSRPKPARRGLMGLALAACVCAVAAFAWYSYGREARLIVAGWVSQRFPASLPLLLGQDTEARPSPSAIGAAATDAAIPQPAPPVQTAPQDAVPKAAPMAPELAQWLQTAARDLANLEQGIKQLKASQEQIARDNAELAERLRATEVQMARDNAAVAEQLKATEAQMARDNAEVVGQLKAAQSQITRENAALSEQLKASQEQRAAVIARTAEQGPRPKPRRQIATTTAKPAFRPPQATARPQPPAP